MARETPPRRGLIVGWYGRRRFAEMFTTVVISGEHGVRKPEPAIYQIAVGTIGLPAEQLVFVDDLGSSM